MVLNILTCCVCRKDSLIFPFAVPENHPIIWGVEAMLWRIVFSESRIKFGMRTILNDVSSLRVAVGNTVTR